MIRQFRLLFLLLAWIPTVFSCVSESREGLPPGSPFAESVAPVAAIGTNPLPQGIAVGDVTSQSALLWFRTEAPRAVQIEWASVAAWELMSKMATIRSPAARTAVFATSADRDYTLTIPLDGLASATRYRYHVLVGQAQGETMTLAAHGEFTTLPDAANSAPVTFAWSGDLGGQGRCRRGAAGYPIFDVMRAQQLDFFLFLGDTVYGDSLCPSPPNEPGADFRATTLAEYRARHRDQRGAEALQRFLDNVPVYVIWDDHEVRNNFAGPFDSQMPAGRQALREYWPIRVVSDDPERLYRTVRAGADIELFILDTRQYRSRNADQDGPTKTMLGERQLQWLLSGLTESTATWKVIVTTVPLSISKGGGLAVPGNDGWAGGTDGTGFERERQVIVDHILSQRVTNVVFLACDVHYVQANAYDPNGDGIPDFHEFVAGPLSASPGRLTQASVGLRPTTLINEGGYMNFGLVRVTKSSLDVTVLDEAGATRFSHHLAAK